MPFKTHEGQRGNKEQGITNRWSEWRRTVPVSGFGRLRSAAIAHLRVGPSSMDAETKARRKAWRAQARADLCRPRVWVFFGCLYAATFLLVSALMYVLELIVPHLPWIPKPYVSTDPPPLVLGFYCANLLPAMLVIMIPVLYVFVPPWHIPFLSCRRNEGQAASPNGGPAEPPGDSRAGGGPASVS